ncbi:MAG TPA: hypothetical protein VMT52_13075 [Planctomycetota bacterium]|nr:hypothetical protein [Planctomycetota bacterium]
MSTEGAWSPGRAARAAVEKEKPGDGALPTSLSALAKELHLAMKGGLVDKAKAVVDSLVQSGSPEAYEIIMREAFAGDLYAVEQHAGAIVARSTAPAVRAKVFRNCDWKTNTNFKSRIVHLAVAAAMADDPGALRAIHAALRDPNRPVMFAAIYWTRKLNQKESLEPLVAALQEKEKKPEDRAYHDLLNALRAISGANLQVSVDWKNFLKGQAQGAPPPVSRKDSPTAIYRRPTFFSVDVDSDSVVFLIDTSQSMLIRDPPPPPPRVVGRGPDTSGGDEHRGKTVVVKKEAEKKSDDLKPKEPPRNRERLFRVKEELVRVLSSLPEKTRFGIVSFNHEISWIDGSKTLRAATAANKSAAIEWVKALVANGATRTDLALEEALSLPDVDTVYLLTDGAPRDLGNQRIEVGPILVQAKEANRFLRARIHTISFAQIGDSRMKYFVQYLAAQNDGSCTLLP